MGKDTMGAVGKDSMGQPGVLHLGGMPANFRPELCGDVTGTATGHG